MRRLLRRAMVPAILVLGWALAPAPAVAQVTLEKFDFLGKTAQSILLHGEEYAREDTLSAHLRITRDGDLVRVQGLGKTLVLPLDRIQARAVTEFNTVQLGATRERARTATLVNGNLYLPLDTLARGLGVQYRRGSFTLPPPQLLGVASHAGKDADRLVLELNRPVNYRVRSTGEQLQVILPGTKGEEREYTTRGNSMPRIKVKRDQSDLVVSVPLSAQSGYRVYRSSREGGVRLVLDVGPGVPRLVPALLDRVARPLIVLDPVHSGHAERSARALELARVTAELLTGAGWQVRLTRNGAAAVPLEQRAGLARQSNVFVSLDVGSPAEPGGVLVRWPDGRSPDYIVSALRSAAKRDVVSSLAVGDPSDNQRLRELLEGELKGMKLPVRQVGGAPLYLLREAPHAALLLQLAETASEPDARRLSTENGRREVARALARAVASFLSARADGGDS